MGEHELLVGEVGERHLLAGLGGRDHVLATGHHHGHLVVEADQVHPVAVDRQPHERHVDLALAQRALCARVHLQRERTSARGTRWG